MPALRARAASHLGARSVLVRLAGPRSTPVVADAQPFHWEYRPGARHAGDLPRRGRPAAGRHRADQRREERGPQAARGGDPDRRALPAHQRPRDRGRPRHGRDAARPRRRRRPPGADNVYEVAAGDVEWLFVPLEAAAKMRAELHPPRPAPGPVRAGHHQQPGRRPDRPPAGRPARRGDARPRRLDRVPQRLLLRDRPGSSARRRGPFPVRVGHGHRERDARGDARRGPHGHPPGGPGTRGRRPHRVPPDDGRGGRADLSRHHRDRGAQAPAWRGAPGHPGPHRGRHVHRRRGRHRRPGHARGRARATTSGRSSRPWAGSASASRAGPTRSRSTAPRCEAVATARATSRPRRIPASRPTSSRRRPCC